MKQHPIEGLMSTTLENIKGLIDANTIVGEPISAGTDTTIIPISQVSYGFGSGGSDFPSKVRNDLFGGGSGAGVSITPVAFLVISGGHVRLMEMQNDTTSVERILKMVPDLVERITDMIQNKGEKLTREEVEQAVEDSANQE